MLCFSAEKQPSIFTEFFNSIGQQRSLTICYPNIRLPPLGELPAFISDKPIPIHRAAHWSNTLSQLNRS
jgi:hypothetical protein